LKLIAAGLHVTKIGGDVGGSGNCPIVAEKTVLGVLAPAALYAIYF